MLLLQLSYVIDFYLPTYGICIEFLGMWKNGEKYQYDYKEKLRVYRQNSIPCVPLWPDNLGTMEYIFPMRARIELKKYNKNNQLFFFEFKQRMNTNYIFAAFLTFAFINYSFWGLYGSLIPIALYLLCSYIAA